MAFGIIGLDGITRESTEVYASECATHRLDGITGYVLRLTRTDDGAHRDLKVYEGATNYGDACEDAHDIRAGGADGTWALVDTVYNCGCRGQA